MSSRGHWMHRILSFPLSQITELKTRLGDSEAQRETLRAEMSSLQSRHSAEVTSLQSQCSALQSKCAGLQDQGHNSKEMSNFGCKTRRNTTTTVLENYKFEHFSQILT